MKRCLFTLMAVLFLCSAGITAQAYTTPSGTTSAPSSGGSSGGGGGGGTSAPSGSTGSSTGTIDPDTGEVDVDNNYPWSVYTPKVTYIKSVNAALANYDSAPVYFMPQLDDFPTPLENVVSDLTDNMGVRHQFAAVYTGYFDNDVTYISAQASNVNNARIRTSKKVYSAEDNSRLLNLLGYDLLLQREAFNIEVENGEIEMSYLPTRIPTNELTAGTCVMDLYKAVGIYEWDIEFAYGVDRNLDVEKSPIIQMIPALTSGEKNKGYDTSESVVWVAATRTNPDQYWNRCLQDAIFDGGLHNITAPTGSFIGSESSVSFSLNSGDQLNLGQFCALARAIMNLYGEPVMTESEQNACLLAYGAVVPKNSYTKEIRDSIIYLAAKGIIDPAEKNFNKNVTFADIEDILLRIADEDSRLTVKTQNISMLSDQGFSAVDRVSVSSGESSIEIIDAEDLQYRDFLVELNDYTMFYMLRSTQGFVPQTSGKPTANYQPLVQSSNPVTAGERAQSTENIAILYRNEPMTQRSGFWRNVGIEEYTDIGGKERVFYHFKINTNQFDSLHFVSSDTYEDGTGTEFTLANSDGGIYYYENGWQYETFADYDFDDTYRDASSTSFTDFPIPLSTSKQMAGLYVQQDNLDKARQYVTYDPAYKWDSMFNQDGTIKTNERITIDSSLMAIAFEDPSNPSQFRMELYGTNINKVLQTTFIAALINGGAVEEKSNVGFYRAEDNTLLVSLSYLQSQKRVLSFNEEGENVYVLGLNSILGAKSKVNTNVVIYNDDTHGFIMVGEMLFPRKNGEVLLEQVGMEYYINAKALTGWASDLVIVPTGNNNCAVAIDATLYNRNMKNSKNDYVDVSGTTIDVHTMVGNTRNILSVLRDVDFGTFRKNNNFNGGGLLLSSAYSLSNYCLVMADDNGTDYLFVYHIRGLDGSVGESGEDAALSRFKQLTGFDLEKDPTYYLSMYELSRSTHNDSFNTKNRSTYYVNPGENTIHYISKTLHGKTIGEVEVTYGWTYSPTKTDDLIKAAEEYAKGNSTDYMLPFAVYKNKCYDINLNVCKSSPTASGFEPLGTLPSYMFGSSEKKIGKISGDLKVTHSAPPSGNNFSDYKVTAAPVGNFAIFKASVDSTIEQVNTSHLYWGTVKLTRGSSGKVTVGRAAIDLDGKSPVIRTYLGSGTNSVFVVQTSEANVTKLLDNLGDKIDSLIGRDARDLVDWDKYTFNRLIMNLDSWSSIVLIFILNILPRVCILLFFVLMLLALIRDVRPWRAFCNSTFDVYKFLTFGHQSVETIDVKRTFLTSIICLALFYMVMDGALFNFIIWISEFVLTLMQN